MEIKIDRIVLYSWIVVGFYFVSFLEYFYDFLRKIRKICTFVYIINDCKIFIKLIMLILLNFDFIKLILVMNKSLHLESFFSCNLIYSLVYARIY